MQDSDVMAGPSLPLFLFATNSYKCKLSLRILTFQLVLRSTIAAQFTSQNRAFLLTVRRLEALCLASTQTGP